MFKGFSKRNASEAALEDDIFSPRPVHGPGAEKENQPTKAATMGAGMLPKERKPIPAKLAPSAASKSPGRDDMLLARRDRMFETVATNQAFERMLDDLQIPSTLRPKLATLESPVKAAMIRSSQFLTLTSPSQSTTTLRRTRSTNSLDLDSQGNSIPPQNDEPSSPFVDLAVSHSRTISVDVGSIFAQSPSKPLKLGRRRAKSGVKETGRPTTPEQFAVMLSKVSATAMDIELVKKLRLYLRNEAAGWTEAFLAHGGYAALDARLMDLLNVEWREEQHDDQCLHEILRCFKALSTSEGGCQALRDHYPHPFIPLIALLYSDKKPGDLSTRQLIVELLLILFELYPSPRPISPRTRPNEIPVAIPTLPAGNLSLFTVLRSILLTERPDPAEQPNAPLKPHDFIENLHVPRIFKTYLQELSDVCRDYFWIFCHPNNTVWLLREVDEARVERPKAPGGMTGGVEYEAMVYLTSHFRLVNACAAAALEQQLPRDHEHSAFKFHYDLQQSGMERIIATARKASTTYYGTLHLEISRYVALAAKAKFTFSPAFIALTGVPPVGMQKISSTGPGSTTPTRLRTVPGAPRLPTPQKSEAIVL